MPGPKMAFVEYDSPEEAVRARLEPMAGELIFRAATLENCFADVADCDILSVFIRSRVSAELLAKMPNLKLIAARATGYDNIDTPAAAQKGVTTSNVPYYGENTVAEHAFALMLSLSRNIHKAYVRTAKGGFSLDGLEGFDLKDKTLGVVGVGHIGLHVIRIANGFGMKVLVHDVKQDHFVAEMLGFEYTDLEDLLSRSHVVTLHVPYSSRTHHLINRKNIKKMRPGALLINTARGPLVDTDALVWALDTGLLGGAGLDVFEGEELVSDELQALSSASKQALVTLLKTHILLNRENVVITPHIAFYSVEALQRILETTIENIAGFVQGQPLNIVAGPAADRAA